MRLTLSPRALNSDLYNENKHVFKFFLNDSMEIDDRSSYGKLFHVFGPQKSKLASPFFESTLGIFKYNVSLLERWLYGRHMAKGSISKLWLFVRISALGKLRALFPLVASACLNNASFPRYLWPFCHFFVSFYGKTVYLEIEKKDR